jgi:hypothetical protein
MEAQDAAVVLEGESYISTYPAQFQEYHYHDIFQDVQGETHNICNNMDRVKSKYLISSWAFAS